MTKRIEEEYKKLSQNEHVLKRPGMYLGSIEGVTKHMYVSDVDFNVSKREITYVPAFVKLFDEILTNASDHAIRTGNKVKNIRVTFSDDLSEISVYNDGPGIPVEMHKEEKMYVPELIFGHMLSGSNFDDSEERFVGGMNGMGSVLVNLFSRRFVVETADRKKHYTQVFQDNMNVVNKPVIVPSKDSFTRITYSPDFSRLQVPSIEDTISLIIKRCIDIAAYNTGVRVFVNDRQISVRSLADYIGLHTDNDEIYFENINENYTIAVTESNTDAFENVSIVNGITTYVGGTHVNVITDQLVEQIKAKLVKGNKNIKIRNSDIRNKLMVFIICRLPNPVFDTQSKENLISKIANRPVISDKLIKQVCGSSIVESIKQWVLMKEQAELAKINKGKTTNVRIAKLQDAHKAGSKEGSKCKLILCEGDCLDEDTIMKVFRDGEYITTYLKDIKLSDYVITHNGNIRQILNITKKVKKCKEIVYANTRIVCSDEHKLLVYDSLNRKFQYLKANLIDKERHKLVRSKLFNLDNLYEIKKIERIDDVKYKNRFYIDGSYIDSSDEHRFTILDMNELKFVLKSAVLLREGDLIVSVFPS